MVSRKGGVLRNGEKGIQPGRRQDKAGKKKREKMDARMPQRVSVLFVRIADRKRKKRGVKLDGQGWVFFWGEKKKKEGQKREKTKEKKRSPPNSLKEKKRKTGR